MNAFIKNGGWKVIVGIEITFDEITSLIGEEFYNLEDAIVYHLIFVYRVYIGNIGNTELKKIIFNNKQ